MSEAQPTCQQNPLAAGHFGSSYVFSEQLSDRVVYGADASGGARVS
jgi:hypothetical protein